MAAATATATGIPDSAAGAGVNAYLGLQGDLGALLQGVSQIPVGDMWTLAAGTTWTPTLMTEILPAQPIMAYRVPAGKALLFQGGSFYSLTAATEFVRVVRRYFLYGFQATAGPAAPAAPTVALRALSDGIGTAGVYSYKVAPYNAFFQEGALSPASLTVTLTSTNRSVDVNGPAFGTGVIGYNIYRTLANGSTYFWIGNASNTGAYTDTKADADVDQTLVPGVTWATGEVLGETTDGPVEVISECGTPALVNPPTILAYRGMYPEVIRAAFCTVPLGVGARQKQIIFAQNTTLIPIATAAGNLWRGPNSTATRTRVPVDYGITRITGISPNPTAGSLMFFGQQVIGSCERYEATAAIRAQQIVSLHPGGVLLPPGAEIVVEIGALATGVASQRHISLHGLLLPTTAT